MSDKEYYYKEGLDRGKRGETTSLGIFNLADAQGQKSAREGWEVGQSALAHAEAIRDASKNSSNGSSSYSGGSHSWPENVAGWLVLVGAGLGALYGMGSGFISAGIGGAIVGAMVGAILGAVSAALVAGLIYIWIVILIPLAIVGGFIWAITALWDVGKPVSDRRAGVVTAGAPPARSTPATTVPVPSTGRAVPVFTKEPRASAQLHGEDVQSQASRSGISASHAQPAPGSSTVGQATTPQTYSHLPAENHTRRTGSTSVQYPAPARTSRYMGADGCMYEADGRVVVGYKKSCDRKGS